MIDALLQYVRGKKFKLFELFSLFLMELHVDFLRAIEGIFVILDFFCSSHFGLEDGSIEFELN